MVSFSFSSCSAGSGENRVQEDLVGFSCRSLVTVQLNISSN